MTPFLFLAVTAYVIGSIPFSQIVAQGRAGVWLREVGEGNVGSRNVWHVVGPGWGALAAVLDGAKGLLSYELSVTWHTGVLGAFVAGIAVVLGHQFPIFLRGQGGKGVAAMVGFLLVLSPLSTLTALAAFGLVFLIRHDFNPGITVGIIGLIVLPVLYRQPLWVAALTLVLALLLGGKKWLDSPHEARVWARHPWKGGARPGFQNIEPEDEAAPSSDTQPR